MSLRKRKRRIPGSPRREFDTEFFNLVIGLWYLLMGLIFAPAFKVFLDYKPSRILFYLVVLATVLNVLLRTILLIEKKLQPSFDEKISKEQKDFQERQANKRTSPERRTQNPQELSALN